MLSQKITKAALTMETAKSEEEFLTSQRELANAARLWETSHNALQYGDEQIQLDNVNNSEETFLLFLESEPHYEAIRSAVNELLTITFGQENRQEQVELYTDHIQQHEDEFLQRMDLITFGYDNESRERVQYLSQTEYLLLAIALGLLLMEGVFIFRPVIRRMDRYTRELIDKEHSLEVALEKQKKEKEKVEYLNIQARTVFSNVRQGIFLMDKNFTISELHSQVLEDIFRSDKLAGANFVKLLRPKLVKRDQEALESFLKQLFNPKTKEKVLKKLNPVEKVEVFHSDGKDAAIESRHLSISFSRIWDRDKIQSVLVNISDDTDTVLLQKQIQESEERNRRESVQLLSILKVDPLLIKQLLTEIDHSLKVIMQRYEQGKEEEFQELINYTFNTIHNLKGNASLIDLQLLEEKFHQIEEIITEIRAKDAVVSKDFLKILFEINEVNLIVSNMQQMLTRISEVNMKMQGNPEKVWTNKRLKESLEKGFKKICAETDMRADFVFEDNDVSLPEEYLLTVKDITIQLARNSLAHGIEPEYERIIASKAPEGKMRLTIEQVTDEEILLIYEDNGRGLDPDKIATRAIESELVDPTRLQTMNEQELSALIFEDGFSTSPIVDKISGRGQGMSLVRSLIERFDGEFSIHSRKGEYFRMVISLPAKIQPLLRKTQQ